MPHYIPTEARPNEVFLGNTTHPDLATYLQHQPHLKGLSTLRLGSQALDIEGHRLPPDCRPLFLSRSEEGAYDRAQMAELSRITRGLPKQT